MALVEHLVNRLIRVLPNRLDRNDLVQAGMVGMIEAVRRFDPDRGVAFSTFAGRRIEGSIRDSVRRADWLPRALRTEARRVATVEGAMTSDAGRRPTSDELADRAGVQADRVEELRIATRAAEIRSLDWTSRSSESNSTLRDNLPSTNASNDSILEERELVAYLRDGIRVLPEKHRLVIIAYFLEQKQMGEIAEFLGVTQSRVSQIKEEAVQLLRHGIRSQYAEVEAPDGSKRARAQMADHATAIQSQRSPLLRLDDDFIDVTDLIDDDPAYQSFVSYTLAD